MATHLIRTFKFALRLNEAEGRAMARELERQRLLYNAAHQERQDAYRWAKGQAALLGLSGPSRAAVDAVAEEGLDDRRLRALRALREWNRPSLTSQKASMGLDAQRDALGEVVHDAAAVVTRWTLGRVDAAWQGFFDRFAKGETPGYPRYRSAGRWRTWGCDELSDSAFLRPTGEVPGSRALGFLKVPNVDEPLAVRMHRMLPDGATVRSCTFTRQGDRWTVALACRVPITHGCETDAQLAGIGPDEILAYDGGVAFQATDDAGRRYPNARQERKRRQAVRKASRRVARARRGSGNRARAVARLASLKRSEANGRSTASRQNASALVGDALGRRARAVAREDLALAAMMRSAAGTAAEPGRSVARKRGLNRALADAALARFARDVGSKAESAGLRVIVVDPRWTSLGCSGCGGIDRGSLGDRTYRCVSCGLTMDRDHNAAVNIGRKASALYAPKPTKPAARRGRRSCASGSQSVVPTLDRDGERLGRRVSN